MPAVLDRGLPTIDAELLQVVRQLPPRQREIVVLRYVIGMTSDEIAAALDISAATVRVHHMRAMQKLREALTDRVPPVPIIRADHSVQNSTALQKLSDLPPEDR